MKKINLIIAMIVFGSFFSMNVHAQVFDLTTGTNGSGGAGTIGTNDPLWTMQLPGGTTFNSVGISTGAIETGGMVYPNAYVHNSCGQWISPWLNAANNIISTPGTTGTFIYRRQFTIDNCLINPTAQLSFTFMAADNGVTAVRVNGVAQTIPAGITHLVSGSMSSTPAVVNGVNTIEVDVRNDGAYTALQLCGNIVVSGTSLDIPQNLNCCSAQKKNLLSWNPVAGATSYQVEITYNDPACCRTSQLPTGMMYTVTDNVLLFTPGNCYSWRIRAVNGPCLSKWSEKKCGCYGALPTSIDEPAPNPQNKVGRSNNTIGMQQVDEVMTNINPNPADHMITVNISNPTGTLKTDVCNLEIVDLSGLQVLRAPVQLNIAKEIKIDGLRPGMYICKIVADGRVVSSQKLVVK
jgi:hypothetical protein